MNSSNMMTLQNSLVEHICIELNEPMKNYEAVEQLLGTLKYIDEKRREVWNEEKFGSSDKMAGECYDDITSINDDDIPF